MAISDAAYNVRIGPDGAWTFYEYGTPMSSGTVAPAGTYRLAAEAKGATITTYIDGKAVATYRDPTPETQGRVKLGTDFHRVAFDNLKVEKIDGYTPYASAQLDNMDGSVAYDGAWSRKAAFGDTMDWYRSTSTSTATGASVTVPFKGTGVDVIGGNDGSAVLDVHVDGTLIARDAKTTATDKRLATYALRGLPDGMHRVTFVLKSGKIVLDAFNALSGARGWPRGHDTDPRPSGRDRKPGARRPHAGSWALFANAASAAKAAVDGQKGLDVIGVEQIVQRLGEAYDGLAREDGAGQ
ncbi:hypothetical protein ACFY0F_29820 [Streptomyces sp. NPDC001544]|uniref:hypothetical protein n=1 Tax=Streptomyces sp. NPDC001544 TaxID=3364584 RepID=UPI0036821489